MLPEPVEASSVRAECCPAQQSSMLPEAGLQSSSLGSVVFNLQVA